MKKRNVIPFLCFALFFILLGKNKSFKRFFTPSARKNNEGTDNTGPLGTFGMS